MTHNVKYFFDIPVYRITEDKYNSECEAYIDEMLFPKDSPHIEQLRALDKADPTRNMVLRGNYWHSYGGCWQFNEVIGYIRLHFLGSQVRGEYFSVNKSRIVRTRNRTLENRTNKLAPEMEIPQPITSEGIFATVSEYLVECKKALPRRYIETEQFNAIAKHLDWNALYFQ